MNAKTAIKRNKQMGKSTKKEKKTLSRLIEEFFEGLASPDPTKNIPYTPIVRKLSGIMKTTKRIDYKKEITEALIEKYLK